MWHLPGACALVCKYNFYIYSCINHWYSFIYYMKHVLGSLLPRIRIWVGLWILLPYTTHPMFFSLFVMEFSFSWGNPTIVIRIINRSAPWFTLLFVYFIHICILSSQHWIYMHLHIICIFLYAHYNYKNFYTCIVHFSNSHLHLACINKRIKLGIW